MKKDKIKILDEVLTEDRIKSFLELEAPANEDVDFHRLQKAYRSMPAEYFELFVDFFIEAGGNINAKSPQGITLLQEVSKHSKAEPYRNILLAANAQ